MTYMNQESDIFILNKTKVIIFLQLIKNKLYLFFRSIVLPRLKSLLEKMLFGVAIIFSYLNEKEN